MNRVETQSIAVFCAYVTYELMKTSNKPEPDDLGCPEVLDPMRRSHQQNSATEASTARSPFNLSAEPVCMFLPRLEE